MSELERSDEGRQSKLEDLHLFIGIGSGNVAKLLICPKRETGVVECVTTPDRLASLYSVEVIEKAFKAWGLSKGMLFLGQKPAMVALDTAEQVHCCGERPCCRTNQGTISG